MMTHDEDFAEELRLLLEEGQKIEAVKLYRERMGVGLQEAKDAVEALERDEASPRRTPVDSSSIEPEILSLLEQHRKIEAVKLYRERMGVGLKEAKDAVERIAHERGIPSSGGGCLGVLFLLVAGLAGGWNLFI